FACLFRGRFGLRITVAASTVLRCLRLLTIVGGVREAWVVWARGTQSTLRARGPWLAWSSGPSTSPLAAMAAKIALLMLWCSCIAACAKGPTVAQVPEPPQIQWCEYHFTEVQTLASIPVGIREQLGAFRTGTEGVADK